jgi:hypothetical protein
VCSVCLCVVYVLMRAESLPTLFVYVSLAPCHCTQRTSWCSTISCALTAVHAVIFGLQSIASPAAVKTGAALQALYAMYPVRSTCLAAPSKLQQMNHTLYMHHLEQITPYYIGRR